MSETEASLYAGITDDVEMSAYQVWAAVRESARTQDLGAADVRAGQDGVFWRGMLLGVMEEAWPELGGDARMSKEANNARLRVHTFLTRRGLMHCDQRGSRHGSLSLWWVSDDWDPRPAQPTSAKWAAPGADEQDEQPEEPSSTEPYEYFELGKADKETLLIQMREIICAAQGVGSPLTTTALAQLPTGVGPANRRVLLLELERRGAVERRDAYVPSGHVITVWVVPGSPVPDGVMWAEGQGATVPDATSAEASPADLFEAFMDGYRRTEAELAETREQLTGAQARLNLIDRALGR